MTSTPPPRGKRVLSGIKASGTQHLGNYFGAVRQHIDFQEGNQGTYFIADYHSMTTITDARERRDFAHAIALDYLALGLDSARSIFYRQSDLPETTELTWMLDSVTPKGLLDRAHAFKDAVASGAPVNMGLYNYPVLMAADILIHRSDIVPVGQDNKQHVEMARDIAIKFNNTYGEVLTIPEVYVVPEVATVPGTDGRKMSKAYGNTIEMFAPDKQLRKQVMGVVTDSTPVEEPKDPQSSKLYQLWKLFAKADEAAEMADRFRAGGLGYGEVKKDLLNRILEYFGPARERRVELARDPDAVEDMLRDGARRARETALELVATCREVAGLGPPR